MLKGVSVTFVAKDEKKVLKLLKMHFVDSCRIEKITKGGEIKNGREKGVFTFYVPPEEADDFMFFLDAEGGQGKTLEVRAFDDDSSKDSIWYEVVVL